MELKIHVAACHEERMLQDALTSEATRMHTIGRKVQDVEPVSTNDAAPQSLSDDDIETLIAHLSGDDPTTDEDELEGGNNDDKRCKIKVHTWKAKIAKNGEEPATSRAYRITKFKCIRPGCDYTTYKQTNITRHLKSCGRQQTARPYRCIKCDKSYILPQHLKRHWETKQKQEIDNDLPRIHTGDFLDNLPTNMKAGLKARKRANTPTTCLETVADEVLPPVDQ
jgi:hypothetical protein